MQHVRPHRLVLNDTDEQLLHSTLHEYAQQGIIERCDDDGSGFFSTLFTRTKRDGSGRVIFNLSKLNEHVETIHFKMETIKDALLLMTPYYYMASIDFKHAYYSVPVEKDHRKYLRFMWNGHCYQFTVFPQGLSSVPRAFTKLMKVPFSKLRRLGFTIIGYIDDTLFIEKQPALLNRAVSEAIALFSDLGLTISYTKSVLQPSQKIEYLGLILNSETMTVSLADRKKLKIRDMAIGLLRKQRTSIQHFSEFIGNLVAAALGVYRAPLFFQGLERAQNNALRVHRGDYTAHMTLTPGNRVDIQWWADNIVGSSAPILYPEPACVVTSDASNTGWGAWCDKVSTGGHWSSDEKREHINWLELKGAFLALQTFCANKSNCHIKVMLDNTTAIACIMKYGSSSRDLMSLTRQLFQWAIEKNLHITAAHIPGLANCKADAESRSLNLDTEWQLKTTVFESICSTFGTPDIDLFATRINTQLPRYVAWRPDPYAELIDAFSIPWRDFYGYAFPPFSIINQVIQKVERERSRLVLVAPDWPTKSWYPRLVNLSTKIINLPMRCLTMPQDPGLHHRLETKLRLKAFRLF